MKVGARAIGSEFYHMSSESFDVRCGAAKQSTIGVLVDVFIGGE
jgi:hypothetical protein